MPSLSSTLNAVFASFVILVRVKLSMVLGVASLINCIVVRQILHIVRSNVSHEDLGRVFRHVQPLADGNVVDELIRLVKA